MRDVVTKQRRLSLAGRKPRISPYIGFVLWFKLHRIINRGPTDNSSALCQVMVWCHMEDKPFPDGTKIHWLNSLAPGKFEWNFRHVIFKQILVIDGWDFSCEITLIMKVTGLHWWSVNIGSGNGLVPSGNKPLPEPMLTQISVAISRH